MTAVRNIYSMALVIVLAHLALAQETKPTAPPLPSAIAAAKKVFISNAGEDNIDGDLYSGTQDRCYTDFYHQVQALNRFELVSSPAEADLVLEVNMTSVIAQTQVGGFGYESIFRLRLVDPKTQVVLWTFYEHADAAVLKANRNRNFDIALGKIVNDLKSLVSAQASSQ